MKPTKEEIKKRYQEALDRSLEAFSKLDEKEWAKKASDHWTAKEHLAYLVSGANDELLVATRQQIAGEPMRVLGFETREDALEFNKRGVAKLAGEPTADLLRRLKSAFEEHSSMIDSLSEADLDKPGMNPEWDRPGTMRDLFAAGYGFLAQQYQQIRRVAKKKVPHWVDGGPPERVHFHMNYLFHYMPLILWGKRAEDMNATYLFTMEGPGGGQWSMRIAAGRADTEEAAADPHDIEIKTKPETWMDLSSGDLSAPIAIMTRKVKISGNGGLAMKLSGLFGEE